MNFARSPVSSVVEHQTFNLRVTGSNPILGVYACVVLKCFACTGCLMTVKKQIASVILTNRPIQHKLKYLQNVNG